MLYKLHTYIFIVGFLAIGFIFAMTYARSFSVMSLAPILAFVTQMGLLLHYSRDDGFTGYDDHAYDDQHYQKQYGADSSEDLLQIV